jgi:calcineurin-like phosphoesterase family protein
MTTLFGSSQVTTWFTADHHFGHERIIDLCGRPFDSVAQMNKTLIERHNMLVEERDIVWMLGDLCMGPITESLALIKELNGSKYLIAGNHDRCFAGYQIDRDTTMSAKQRAEWVQRYLDAGIKHVTTGTGIAKRTGAPVRVRLGGHAVDLSHFPTVGDTQPDDRFKPWRPRRTGASPWLVHGHVHNAWRVQDRQINVGVDLWNFSPVPAEVIAEIIDEEDEHAYDQ